MPNNFKKIICPNCKAEISIDEVIIHQIEESTKEKIAEEQRLKQSEFNKKEKEITEREKALVESEKSLDKKVVANTEKAKVEIEKELRIKISKEKDDEIKGLSEELESKDKSLAEARKAELELRQDKRKFEDEKAAFELEKQRQLDAERVKIKEEATKSAEEGMHLKLLEKDKQLQDALKTNTELQRKLQQGSQQTQGEVLELELEELLKQWFVYDSVEPVPKGISGADVIQRVANSLGQKCGSIAWESKNAKDWRDEWITKLKDDQRKINTDIAVIVTKALPKDIKNFAYRDGVWITDFDSTFGLGTALRMQLIQATTIKLANVGKNEKMEVLYRYLSGAEFKHKVEGIVEAFVGMKQDLDKEKRSMSRIWSKREKQIEQVITNTSSMYGDVQGLIGSAVQPIAALESGLDSKDDDGVKGGDIEDEDDDVEIPNADKEELKPEDLPF